MSYLRGISYLMLEKRKIENACTFLLENNDVQLLAIMGIEFYVFGTVVTARDSQRFDIVHARQSFHVIVRWRQRYHSWYPCLLAASFNTVLKTLKAPAEERYMNREIPRNGEKMSEISGW